MENIIMQNPALIWIIAGVAGLLLELALPGLIVMFFGLGALITGVACWVFPIGFELQLLIFLLSSVLFIVFFRKVIKKSFYKKAESQADMDEEFVGKVAVAMSDFVDSKGKVDFKGSAWGATSIDTISKGDMVKIIDRDSITLVVTLIKK